MRKKLVAAVVAQRELFEMMNLALSIAGNAVVPVDKKLLGL
jgi:hypothetical protein|tara:strand:- start:42 stop:164 length:123 start_codon:yes stop_codon:yes gene_type:complete